jgi:hypothetical protein
MPSAKRTFWRILWALGGVAWCLVPACRSAPTNVELRAGEIHGLPAAEVDSRAARVQRDPRAYLYEVAEKCRQLREYKLLFTRYERRGLFQQLYGPEHVECWFRREPFSIRMKWTDADTTFAEAVYVAGTGPGKVRFVTRKWVFGCQPPPHVNSVDLQAPIIFGVARGPITDFGLERLMERTLRSLEGAGNEVVISYQGLVTLPDNGPTAHDIRLEYSGLKYKLPVQELYVDVTTDLPAGTVLKRASGEIDASYFYSAVDRHVGFDDNDFRLEAERGGKGA